MTKQSFMRPAFLIIVALIGVCCWISGITWFMAKHAEIKQQSSHEIQWRTYQYADSFSFEYPASWFSKTEKNFDTIPTIILSSPDGTMVTINPWHTKEFRGTYYSSQEEKRVYGKHIVIIKTFYYQKKPIEQTVVFENNKSPIQTMTIAFPSGDVTQSKHIFNHILSSLKFEY